MCAALTCGVDAKVYDLGRDASKNSNPKPIQTQNPEQPLGWGSKIQNARLARVHGSSRLVEASPAVIKFVEHRFIGASAH